MDKRLLVRLFVPVVSKEKEKLGKVGKTGTGYPVSPELILTAAHVACPADRDPRFPIEVLWHDDPYGPRDGWYALAEQDLIWRHPTLDAALLHCPRPPGVHGFGVVDGNKPADGVAWSSAGFPDVGKDEMGRRPVGFSGQTLSMSDRAGYFEIDVTAAPDEAADWRGASGMPICLSGGSRIIGVAREVPAKMGARRLHAVPTWKLLQDPTFRSFIPLDDRPAGLAIDDGRHAEVTPASPAVIEPPDNANGLAASGPSSRQETPMTLRWYVSYAWGDETPEGVDREKAVNQLCDAAAARGIRILRDKEELAPGDCISAFMQQIGTGDRIFVILSEKYLRSPYCMYELSEIWRTSKQEGDAFRERVWIYVVDGVRVREPVDWARWAIHWKKAHDELDAVARQHGTTMLGEPGYRRLKQMQGFYTQVADILGTLSDTVQPHTFADLLRCGFGDPSPEQSQLRPAPPPSRTQPSPLPTASGEQQPAGPATKQLRGGREQEQANPMNARPEPAPGALLAIVLLATGWGPQHGGINSFNHDFAGGLARALGEHGKVFCAVPTPAREADAKAVAEAGQAGVTLLSMTGTTTSDRFDPNWTAAIHLRLQRDHGVAAVFCWVGHDVISGDAAVHAAREFGGKCALIMHMSYRRYQTVKTGDAADADRKSREQQALFSNPDIQAFAVGPLLLEACRDWSPGTPVMLVPGFAPIGAPRPPASGLVAITFGRLDQREDRIKQGRLAADGFARATKDDEKSPIPSSRLKNGILFLLGLSADVDGEAGEIRKNANKIADRVININPLAYDTDRAAVLRRLQTASLALMLSWHEGFGLTGWEAIAAELPLVASENSGLYKLVREELGDSGTALLHHIDVKGSMGEAGEPNYHGDDLAGVSLAIRKIAHDLQNCQNNAKELKRRLTEKLGCTWEKAGEQFLAGLADPSRPKESPAAERERQQRERWKAERTAKLEAEILNLLKSSAALMTKLEDHRPPDADPGSPAPSAADERARRIFDLLMSVSPFEDALDWLLRVHRDLGIGDNAAKATLAEISKRLIPWLYIVSHPHPEEIAALVPTDLGDVLPLSLGRHSFAELVAAGLEARAADYVGAPGARQQQGSRSISDPPLEGPDADIEEKIRRKLLTEAEGLPEFAQASPAEQDRAINRALRFFQDGQDPKRYYFTFFAGDYDKALLERIAGRYQPLAVIRLSKDWRDTHHAWSLIISDLLGHRI